MLSGGFITYLKQLIKVFHINYWNVSLTVFSTVSFHTIIIKHTHTETHTQTHSHMHIDTHRHAHIHTDTERDIHT